MLVLRHVGGSPVLPRLYHTACLRVNEIAWDGLPFPSQA
jgi:hypothetical protein